MSRIRSKNTKPELILRKYLHRSGYRFRITYPLFGKPDIVFPKKKVTIFVHGCFWHKHNCKNSVTPKTNTDFWRKKLDQNACRDKKVRDRLMKDGWKILVFWECEIKNMKRLEKEILENLRKTKIM